MSDDNPYSDILYDAPGVGITGKKVGEGYFITKEKLLERDRKMREEGAKAERERITNEIVEVLDEYVKITWNGSVETSDLRKWIELTIEKYNIPVHQRGYACAYAGSVMFKDRNEHESLRSEVITE